MNLNEKTIDDVKQEILDKLNSADDKSAAIMEALEEFTEVKYSQIISEVKAEAEKSESDKDYAQRMNLRPLSKKEKEFYEKFKDIKQAVSTSQIDAIPNSIIDLTLEDIRQTNSLLSHINFAPADVKRWYTASKTGSYAWAKLTAALEEGKDITATFDSIVTDLGKLYILLIIPKSIRDLSLPFVDKYFRAVLKEQEEAGLTYGFLEGNGVEQPIGIYNQIDSVDGTTKKNKPKTINTNITKFTPKGLAPAKKYLTNGGKRSLNKLILICNPADRADYVDPALFDAVGNLVSSYKNIEVIDTPENVQGKAALYVDKTYTMGFSGMNIKDYDQTLALDDADVLIGTGYANGRAIDDNCAYVFDVTKLEEYIPLIQTVVAGTVNTKAESTTTTEQVQGA